MALEIERKFLVKWLPDDYKNWPHRNITDGVFLVGEKKSVRVRYIVSAELEYQEGGGLLTLKTEKSSTTRLEIEKPLTVAESWDLLEQCEKGISKIRYHYTAEDGKLWEIDVFKDKNNGLVLAEIELSDENEFFVIPPFIGEEVTNDRRYLGVNLAGPGFIKRLDRNSNSML